MYSLREAIGLFSDNATKDENAAMYCFETNAVTALRTNEKQGFFACYVFTLVERGWLTIRYNSCELTFYPDDLYTYSPGLHITVIEYINQLLLMEASFLLQTSQLSITQIADRLHFADTPSFSKFFSRLKGKSPRAFREQ